MRKNNLIGFILLAFGLLFVFNLTGSIWRLWQQNKPLEEMQKRLEELREENERLQREEAYIKSERFLEEQARNKLNWAKEDEAIVILPEEMLNLKEGTEEKEEVKEPANWQKWLEVFW